MDDLISRQVAMEEISKQQTYKMFEGEDTLYLDANDVGSVLASLPSAQPETHEERTKTHSCDCISRQAAIDAVEFGITYAKAINKSTGEVKELFKEGNRALNEAVGRIKDLPSTQPEPSQVARDIATIIENEKDMRVVSKNEHLKTDKNVPFGEFVSRKKAIEAVKDALNPNIVSFVKAKMALEALPSAQPEKRTENTRKTHGVCLDTISRKAAIEAMKSITDSICEQQAIDALCELPSAQPDSKETSSTHKALDTISRQAVIEINRSYHGQMPNEVNHRIWEEINALPSAQPEIIRCNDCKHWTQTTGNMRGFGLGDCDYINAKLVNCNGFCYWAERRTDE